MTLTPYDTGARLEPRAHVTSTAGLTRDNRDDFGKVDFDDEEGSTLFVAHIEKTENGYLMKIYPNWFDGDFTIDVID